MPSRLVLSLLFAAACSAPASNDNRADLSGPPRTINDCTNLSAPGTWEEITPPGVSLPGPVNAAYGVNAVLLDPLHAGTVYLGTSQQGIWKTTNCGATWVHINTGLNGARLDSGRNWTMAADPIDSQILYSNAGFGAMGSGLFRSTNGGVDWTEIWPPQNVDPSTFKGAPGFIGTLTLDPYDHTHLVVDFHENCTAPHTPLCLIESKDSGSTWRVIDTDPAMGMFAAHDALHSILENGQTWLYTANGSFWRTADSGAHWSKVAALDFHSAVFRAPDGAFYVGCKYGIARSENGIDWAMLPDSGQLVGSIITDGKQLLASKFTTCSKWADELFPYMTAPLAGGAPWTEMKTPGFEQGGALAYDRDHKILYSSNCQQGLWRVVLP